MRLSLHWRTLGSAVDLETLLGAASGAGFAGVEARRADLLAFARRHGGSGVARLFAQQALCQVATPVGVDLGASEADFEAACTGGQQLCRYLRGLTNYGVGQTLLTVAAPPTPPAGPGAERTVTRLRLLADLAASAGFALLLDPEPPGEAAPVAEVAPAVSTRRAGVGGDAVPPPAAAPRPTPEGRAAELAYLCAWVAAADRPNVGLVFDGWRWPGPRSLPPGLPLHCRIADAPPEGTERLLPGRGGRDLAGALQGLRAIEYAGYVSVDAPVPGTTDPYEGARRARVATERVVDAAFRF